MGTSALSLKFGNESPRMEAFQKIPDTRPCELLYMIDRRSEDKGLTRFLTEPKRLTARSDGIRKACRTSPETSRRLQMFPAGASAAATGHGHARLPPQRQPALCQARLFAAAHASASGNGWANLPGKREGPLGMASSVADSDSKSRTERFAMGTCKGSFTSSMRYHGAVPIA